jgi:hypothetical protein
VNDKEQNLTALVWQHAPSAFYGTDLVVLLKLAGLSQKEGHAFAGVERLAAMCGVKPRALRYALRQLTKGKVLKIKSRRGHSNHYFLDADAIKKLPLVLPNKPSAEAVKLSADLEFTLRTNPKEAVIPSDWQTAWPVELQKLFDVGHNDADIRTLIKFAIVNEWWSGQLENNFAQGLVENFARILSTFKAEKKAA